MPGHLRVACVQMNPLHNQVERNCEHALNMLKKKEHQLKGVHLLVLPEMIMTGYHWRDADHIQPVLEAAQGQTHKWCKSVAKMLSCVVCCGVPRRKGRKRLNSMIVTSPRGKVVEAVDKVHLYESDKTWAEPGDGFKSVETVEGLPVSPVGFGICMDINPADFKAPAEKFEFANFHLQHNSKLLVFTSAWCKNHPDDKPEAFAEKSDAELSQETIDAWLNRLRPLHGKRVIFVCANRVGKEELRLLGRDTDLCNQFCGTSCVISLEDQTVVKHLSASEEGILIADIPVPCG
ncbi:nta1 [Symbiodinium necroappetens]|uniref:Nta1 protein n=1 Tax=Symbiodinium necroappetens TaxID=1628268 RepID=A0A812RQH0_9DINO|nr:nta1 [Symbiodinium necroappetens]